MGYVVTMVGRTRPNSTPFNPSGFKAKRFSLIFQSGFLFYAEYNIRLFLYLLMRKADLYVSNDLDTLSASFLVSRIKGKELVYDSHEYFLGSTEIVHRPMVRMVWGNIERAIFPRLKHVITVNQSIADLYEKQYGLRPVVVRNLPPYYRKTPKVSRQKLGLPAQKKIVLMQGGGINVDRGAEELIHAMKATYGLDNVHLLFIGGGDRWENLKVLTRELHLERKVSFLPKMPWTSMMQYTSLVDIGVSVDKPVSLNYKYSLPNKLFDYIAAGIPVLASELVEVKNVVAGYNVGTFIESHEPRHIAKAIKYMLEDTQRYQTWKTNTQKAAKELCWEVEEKMLERVYGRLGI